MGLCSSKQSVGGAPAPPAPAPEELPAPTPEAKVERPPPPTAVRAAYSEEDPGLYYISPGSDGNSTTHSPVSVLSATPTDLALYFSPPPPRHHQHPASTGPLFSPPAVVNLENYQPSPPPVAAVAVAAAIQGARANPSKGGAITPAPGSLRGARPKEDKENAGDSPESDTNIDLASYFSPFLDRDRAAVGPKSRARRL